MPYTAQSCLSSCCVFEFRSLEYLWSTCSSLRWKIATDCSNTARDTTPTEHRLSCEWLARSADVWLAEMAVWYTTDDRRCTVTWSVPCLQVLQVVHFCFYDCVLCFCVLFVSCCFRDNCCSFTISPIQSYSSKMEGRILTNVQMFCDFTYTMWSHSWWPWVTFRKQIAVPFLMTSNDLMSFHLL